jgi:hypothetical protein
LVVLVVLVGGLRGGGMSGLLVLRRELLMEEEVGM